MSILPDRTSRFKFSLRRSGSVAGVYFAGCPVFCSPVATTGNLDLEELVARRKGLVINHRQLDLCDDLLQKLKEVSGSSFLALISTSGQPITTASQEYHPETLSLASLAASSFAATQQLAKILDENEFTLLFHEGKGLNLHVTQVTDQVLLLITFGHETQVGKVRLYSQRAVEVLREIFEGPDDSGTPEMDADFESAAAVAMDDLFRDS